MIKITIKKNDNFIEEIRIHGHAKYDEYGKDIVCAGVSSALITTVNACLIFDNESLEYNDKNNFYLKNIKQDEITNKLLENLVNVFKSIESKYKENIIVKEEH